MRVGSSSVSRCRRALAALIALVAFATFSAPASAQNVQAAATIQFDQGRALMKQGKYAEACAAFAKSQQLDPQNGTLFNLAECDTHIGKLASAWLAYRDLAQRDTNPGRGKEAGRRAKDLEKRLPRLLVRVSAAPPGLAMTINGKDATSLVGIDSPVDLGRYRIRAVAPGFADVEATAQVTAEAHTVAVRLELVEDTAVAIRRNPAAEPDATDHAGPASAGTGGTEAGDADAGTTDRRSTRTAGTTAAAPAGEPEPALADEPRAPVSHRRRNGAIAAAVGGGLVIAGLGFGLAARSDWNDAEAACPGHNCASAADRQRGDALVDSARSDAAWSTGLVIGGAAAAAIGVYLIATAHPAATATALRIAPTPGGAAVILGGAF